MGKRFIILGFLLAISLASSVFSASDLPDWKDKHVNDFAGILGSVQADGMRGLLEGIERDTTAEIVFVSDGECTSRGGPGQYALELFSKWEVGKKDKDNGLLVLYCKEENKIWVTTGYGLEGILPDSKIGRMLDDYYVPLRDSGNISEGIVLFVEQVSQVILDNKEDVLSGQAGARDVSIYS
ncbi:MAG TPA: TPM domain-containing protein, partial [Candidatus Nanoarchaeia archaeon]|nr:TPM domain-containing protein [Candidatus Nanoarchaeia archaeon]